tara:strand:- start:1100 stop:1531 length:432 start_codon:yes stop_codon:yes gene_type:complete
MLNPINKFVTKLIIMEYARTIFKSISKLFGCQKEDVYLIEVRHGGNQMIDEFYMKYENGRPNYNKKKRMNLYVEKSKTILDLKKEIKIQRADGTYLSVVDKDGKSNINLREEVFGPTLSDKCKLSWLENEDGIIKVFIQIPDW